MPKFRFCVVVVDVAEFVWRVLDSSRLQSKNVHWSNLFKSITCRYKYNIMSWHTRLQRMDGYFEGVLMLKRTVVLFRA